MTDVRKRLRRASGHMTLPDRAFERMLDRRDRKRRQEQIAAAIVALGVAVVLIGGALTLLSGLLRETARPGSSEGSLPGGGEGDSGLRVCIEGAGYDWDEVWPIWSSPEHPPEDSVFADRAFWQAWQVCLVETGNLEPWDEQRIAEENRETLKYMECMRDRGWNLPDPETSDSPIHPGLLGEPIAVPEDPEAAARYYRGSADCGFPFYDEDDNLLPTGRFKGVG
ncbi:MAG: hypothetical protein ACRDIZ_13135 [Actinomycetota bacterium]